MNMLLNSDSYKYSHFLQYPPGTAGISAYIESRPGGELDHVLFFGLQMFLKEYLARPVTAADVDEAEDLITMHGLPFNRQGFDRLVSRHGGMMPVEIEALPEGMVVPSGVPLVQIRNTDPAFFWLPTFLETALLRAVWYPSTVATISHDVRGMIAASLARTCDTPAEVLPTRLHDFGARGTTSLEQAGLGGVAHLVSFTGTDTVSGLVYARRYYHEAMAGFSIPAAEHSTMTAWGEAREAEAFANMVDRFGGKGHVFAVVSDSYDVYRAIRQVWGETLRDKVRANGGTLVVRPDSGDPAKVPLDAVEMLGQAFGFSVNARGFKVLDPAVRVIQGDGMNPKTIGTLLKTLEAHGWSVENVAFGMGGGLLQKLNRDTLRFAMKANARLDGDGRWIGISKTPKTDPEKASKSGRQAVVLKDGRPQAIAADALGAEENLLRPVWRDGELLTDWTFSAIRARANA